MIVVKERLATLPSCQSIEQGRCRVVGIDATARLCSICKASGPFCGAAVNSKKLDRFKRAVAVVLSGGLKEPFPGIRVLDDDEQAGRLVSCNPCEHNVEGRCLKCKACGGLGRPVDGFVKLSTHRCPLEKW